MKSLSQLKKDLSLGRQVQTIANYCKPERNGEIRTVSKVQSNAVAFLTMEGKNSFLWWPKASEVEYEGDTFKVYSKPNQYNGNQRELLFVYKLLGD